MNIQDAINEYENSLNELVGFHEQSKVEHNRQFLDFEIRRLRAKIEELKKSLDGSAKPVIRYKTISNYSWDQDQEVIKIYLNIADFKDVKKELVKIELSADNQAVTVLVDNGGHSGKLVLKNLSHPLSAVQDPASQVKITKNFVIVALKKAENKKWLSLQKTSDAGGLGKSLAGDAADDEDPSKSMMKLMKNLYETGDDEMKRTIAKAWTQQQDKSPFM